VCSSDLGAIIPRGQTNPLKAIRLILKYKPQVLFILSDNITGKGKYELDQEALLAEIARANGSGTRISTIQYIYSDPLDAIPALTTVIELGIHHEQQHQKKTRYRK